MAQRKRAATVPTPHHRDVRICFGIAYFTNEADAARYAAHVAAQGYTYNGGWFDGMPCGRETTRDYTAADGTRFYAVTE